MKVKTKTSGTIVYVIGEHKLGDVVVMYDCVRRDPKFQPNPKVELQVRPDDVEILEE